MLANFTEEGLNQLITDQVEENIHPDYKAAAALNKSKKDEISKDVSAFANSDGGQIIYGIKEFDDADRKYLPEKIDPIDRKVFSKEQLEQVINSIAPKIVDLRITPIDCSNGSVYVVTIPRSIRPHQASNKKYYKRHNFLSLAMEDYEINDVRGRQNTLLPLINIDAEIRSSHMVYITVSNIGNVPAFDVSFTFPENVHWIRDDKKIPSLFVKGTKIFPPGKIYRFMWNVSYALFATNDPDALRIETSVTYTHGFSGARVANDYYIDLEAYRSGTTLKTDVEELRDTLKEQIAKLTSELSKHNRYMEGLSSLTGPTGLDFSISTLRNMKGLINSGASLEKISAECCPYTVFREVLQVDQELADRIEMHFSHSVPPTLEEIEGITPEIIDKINESFYW